MTGVEHSKELFTEMKKNEYYIYIYQGIRLPDSLPKKKYTISVSFSPTVIVCKATGQQLAGDLAAETYYQQVDLLQSWAGYK